MKCLVYYSRVKRLLWAVQLFFGILWRENYDGTRVSIRLAWDVSGISRRLEEFPK